MTSTSRTLKYQKNLSAGNGFTIVNKANTWKRERARVSLNLLANVVNAACYSFNEDPFEFIPKDSQDEPNFEREELSFVLGSSLRETAVDGISYILTSYDAEENKITFKRLNNFNVMFGQGDRADGKDVKQALYIDKRPSKERWNKSNTLYVKLNSVLELKKDEIAVLTYWKLDEGGVHTYQIEGNKVVSHVFQELSRLPIVRFYGKETFLESWNTWRGFYYQVKDILLTMDYTLSLIQEKIATAPNHLYTIAQEVLGANLDNWANLAGLPKAFLAYKAIHVVNAGTGDPQVMQLPPPEPNNFVIGIEPLIANYEFHLNLLNQTIGNIAGTPQANETAEAVLLRKENKISSVNELIKNLLDSSYEICTLIEDFSGVKMEIQNSLFEKAKREKEQAQIVNFLTFANTNPLAKFTAPVLIKKMELSDDDKTQLIQGLADAMLPTPELVEAQAQLQEAQQQIGQLNIQLEQAQAAIEAQLATAQIKEKGLVERKMMDVQVKIAELQQKYGADNEQLNLDLIKLQQDFDLKSAEIALKASQQNADIINTVAEQQI